MSEYQYYEFLAIDKPLTEEQMGELRAISTRARITPTSFTNFYTFGDFKGEPAKLVEQYFDLFLYLANWGSHDFVIRLPRRLLDPALAQQYVVGDSLGVREAGGHVILEFTAENEDDGGYWVEDEEGHDLTMALTPVREELAMGDHRALYLGWLMGVQNEHVDEDAVEPPVPPGLGQLSPTLESFAEFLYVDPDLLEVAAEVSPPLTSRAPDKAALRRWIADLAEEEKNNLLVQVLQGGATPIRAELWQRFWAEESGGPQSTTGRRTAGELLEAAQARAEAREQEEARRAEEERAHKAREQAAARERHLESMAGREERLWSEVESLVATKRPADYDRAVTILTDLRDLAARSDSTAPFVARLAQLRSEHAKKTSFLDRLARAGLAVDQ